MDGRKEGKAGAEQSTSYKSALDVAGVVCPLIRIARSLVRLCVIGRARKIPASKKKREGIR